MKVYERAASSRRNLMHSVTTSRSRHPLRNPSWPASARFVGLGHIYLGVRSLEVPSLIDLAPGVLHLVRASVQPVASILQLSIPSERDCRPSCAAFPGQVAGMVFFGKSGGSSRGSLRSGSGSGSGRSHGRSWIAIDWDDVLAYKTFKTVKVRDRRLGGLHLFFSTCILVYIIYTIIDKQLYLATENVTGGAVRTTIKPPASLATPPYCTNGTRCMYLSSSQVTPDSEEGTIFVATRISLTNATGIPPDCNPFAPVDTRCQPQFPKAQEVDYYAADVENFTIMVEHTVRGFATSISLRNGDLEGTLLDTDNRVMRVYTPTGTSTAVASEIVDRHVGMDQKQLVRRPEKVPGDVFSVADLLRAANVSSLDLPSSSPSAEVGESMRHAGIVLIVMIDYANVPTRPKELRYTYRVSMIPGAEAKTLENRFIPVGTSGSSTVAMQQWNRHGIRIKFVQTGKLGYFQLIALLTNLVASFALFRLAVIIVEFAMLQLLPEKERYATYKFEVTEDFQMSREPSPARGGTQCPTPAAGRRRHMGTSGSSTVAMSERSDSGSSRRESSREGEPILAGAAYAAVMAGGTVSGGMRGGADSGLLV
ncbi:hypothetical protein BCR44DRAFT_1443346 [Catenaria anguillulae PL171]|uniref:Uncharacterized protein n=1 Tax=Catenaria anguillulae PL171 TaxID=765915 RepID=A0A1Y2HAT7_9FUNG|nr:hypothetical protein BCR44DRAFT_1443346 [Catenaria anguillulae PL171]